MPTMMVSYAGGQSTRFDREYYVNKHLPLVMRAWKQHGLRSLAAFFPAEAESATPAVCLCEFRDDAAMEASLKSPESNTVMADIANFTDAKPTQSRIAPL